MNYESMLYTSLLPGDVIIWSHEDMTVDYIALVIGINRNDVHSLRNRIVITTLCIEHNVERELKIETMRAFEGVRTTGLVIRDEV